MTTPLTHPERVAIARLHALLELLPTALDKRLGPAGVTAFEYTLLDTLADAEGQRMRLSALARKTNATLPRLSRVATSLERRQLIERASCLEDGRAVNAIITEKGAEVRNLASGLYGEAVRELVFDGLTDLSGDGVSQLTDLTYAILKTMDPNTSMDVVPEDSAVTCAADPAESVDLACAADPVNVVDPVELACPADPGYPADPFN